VIQSSYGLGVDAHTYLEKFFHLRVTMPAPDPQIQNRIGQYVSYLWKVMALQSGDLRYDQFIQKGLETLGIMYKLSLRTIERVVASTALFHATTSDKHLRIPCIIVGFCVMKHIDPDLYNEARSGMLEWQNVKKFLRLDGWNDANASELYERWWRYASDESLPQNEEWVGQVKASLFMYNVTRERIVPIACNHIDSLHIIDA
jgi:hypothetical protein